MRTNRYLAALFAIALAISLASCTGASRYHGYDVAAQWYEINHKAMEDRYATATPEDQAWMRKNVNPYMNIYKHTLRGIHATEKGDEVKFADASNMIVEYGTLLAGYHVEYDVAPVIKALRMLRAGDTGAYDILGEELLKIKDIIMKAFDIHVWGGE